MDKAEGSYRRFIDGDDNALTEIITEYRDGLILYINSIVKDLVMAEDLAEDTFVRLFTRKPRLSGEASFKTLLYTIGRNIAIDYLRKEKRKEHMSFDECVEPASGAEGIEDVIIREEQEIALLKEISKLRPAQSQALWLVYYEGMSVKNAAGIMKKSVHSVEMLISRAKAELKKRLTEGGII